MDQLVMSGLIPAGSEEGEEESNGAGEGETEGEGCQRGCGLLPGGVVQGSFLPPSPGCGTESVSFLPQPFRFISG